MSLHKITPKKETFSLNIPQAEKVSLVGSFTGWDKPIDLKRQKDGTWKASVPLQPGVYEYRFLVDGIWYNDPKCPQRVPNPYGSENCMRVVAVEDSVNRKP